MPFEIGATVSGKVIEVNAQGLLVALPDGQTGLLPKGASLTLEAMQLRFIPGREMSFRVVAIAAGGPFTLGLPIAEGEAETPFDQEFHRLNHALTSRSVSPRDVRQDRPTVEQEMEAWVAQVSEGLARLRKHRGTRLNEEFYDENG